MTPPYLFKVIPLESWQASQGKTALQLLATDHLFIHLATEAQLGGIVAKFFRNVPVYVVLKLDVAKLPGTLVLEANPGGTNKYYHLYNGFITREAIVTSQAFRQDLGCDFCE